MHNFSLDSRWGVWSIVCTWWIFSHTYLTSLIQWAWITLPDSITEIHEYLSERNIIPPDYLFSGSLRDRLTLIFHSQEVPIVERKACASSFSSIFLPMDPLFGLFSHTVTWLMKCLVIIFRVTFSDVVFTTQIFGNSERPNSWTASNASQSENGCAFRRLDAHESTRAFYILNCGQCNVFHEYNLQFFLARLSSSSSGSDNQWNCQHWCFWV